MEWPYFIDTMLYQGRYSIQYLRQKYEYFTRISSEVKYLANFRIQLKHMAKYFTLSLRLSRLKPIILEGLD